MILIRHAQSEFNVHFNRTGKDPGIEDPKLTAYGRDQAHRAGIELKERLKTRARPLRRLLSSPYRRAIETAAIIAETVKLPIEIEPIVHEHACFRCDVGSPASHLGETFPALDFAHIGEKWWPELGETEEQLLTRCANFRSKAAGIPHWPELAVVSHWGFILRLTGRELKNAELLDFDPTAARPAPR